MVRRYLRKLIPVSIRTFISKIESFLLFEIYAYRFLGPFVSKTLRQRQTPLNYLFVMAPARSGSSLLGHILYNHAEVTGYGESHVAYASNHDLQHLIYRTAAVLDDFDPLACTYIVDKLVWEYPISDSILQNQQIKFIFLLRDPAATYTSTVKSFSGHESPEEVDKWIAYYLKRLKTLETFATQINSPQRCLTLRYEDLLGDTERTLDSFQRFLGTTAPFSDSYTVAKHTSRLKYGDNSETIKAGKILRRKFHPPTLNDAVFTPQKQQSVYSAYSDCISALKKHTQFQGSYLSQTSENLRTLAHKKSKNLRTLAHKS
ncbi:MAG: sulfotransferase [Leptolyngbyaceae cyanobacterium MAG.088]|nr:sulfotransferase [Leptolyngbyaceae cyanobacterium MAG.088]